jgi:poly(A) polymerase
VVDFHDGIRDAKKKVLRMIGDAAARYREDPVRIIRAVRFGAKLNALGFKFDPKTREPIAAALPLLADVPQSRLFDEMLKLLQTGHALASIAQLKSIGLARGIYPLLDLVVERADDPLVNAALIDTDRRVGEGKPVAPSFLLACVLWQDARAGWAKRLQPRGNQRPPTPFAALQDAVDEVFDARIGDVSGRGKLGTDMREIWLMQPRFDKRTGSGPFGLVEQPRFRAGFDFLRLRAATGEVDEELAHWWETFSTADDDHRRDMVDAQTRERQRGPKTGAKPARAPKVHRVDDAAPAQPPEEHDEREDDPRFRATDGDESAGDETGASDTAPKKRRRRRRKPGGGAAAAGDAPPASE